MNPADSTILVAKDADLPEWARAGVNLADQRLGAQAVACSDDFFGAMDRMLQTGPAIFDPTRYDDHGKWMDGWESRRRRRGGNDWCVVRLARPGRLLGLDIDTSFFTGNYPPAVSVEACAHGADIDNPDAWLTLLATAPLAADQHHLFHLPATDMAFSHVRVQIYPDGGIARLRVYGIPQPDLEQTDDHGLIDLVSATNGGRALLWNDAHYGTPGKLLYPGRGINMGDGWETRRRRSPGFDWCILALAVPGHIQRIEVDTAHFKGNYPDRISLQGILLTDAGINNHMLEAASQFWPGLLEESTLQADHIHSFTLEQATAPLSHVRVNLHPDGGISRLRLWGRPA